MDIYVARQPIFDATDALFGYELLYRSGASNHYDPAVDGSTATCALLSSIETEFGLHSLTGGKYAFINFTKELLESGYVDILDPQAIIIEILEDIQPDEPLLQSLSDLKEKGFLLALDDYDGDEAREGLTALADIIKVDFMLTSPAERARIGRRFAHSKRLLAEKVETAQEAEQARQDGYVLFQGYFFSKPILVSKKSYEVASATCMRLWQLLHQPEISFDELAEIIRLDVNLSYKFLLRANSMAYYRRNRVTSLKHALLQLGLGEVRRWVLAVLMQSITYGQSDIPAKRALVRASFAEQLAAETGRRDLGEDAFITGMFSTFETAEDLQVLLDTFPLSEEARRALLDRQGRLAETLTFISAYEAGAWEVLPAYLEKYGVPPERVSTLYLQAVRYAEQTFGLDADSSREGQANALDLLQKL